MHVYTCPLHLWSIVYPTHEKLSTTRFVGLGNITTLPGTGNPIHQGGYACTGIEDRIVDCNPGTLPSLCSHSDDLTIECNDTGRLCIRVILFVAIACGCYPW